VTPPQPEQLRRVHRILWRYTADGVTVLPLDADAPFTLTGPGATLWGALRNPQTADTAAQTLAETYGVPVETAAAEVRPLLDQLVELGAVTVEDVDP